jgi:hypothetical protein
MQSKWGDHSILPTKRLYSLVVFHHLFFIYIGNNLEEKANQVGLSGTVEFLNGPFRGCFKSIVFNGLGG